MECYIVYEVSGFAGKFEAGPYCQDDAEEHLRDIAGYEGVFGAKIEWRPIGSAGTK